jgi:hypothetical protein
MFTVLYRFHLHDRNKIYGKAFETYAINNFLYKKLSVEYVVYYWMNRLPRAAFMKPVLSVA